jgi:putative RecB family exonuclease
VAKLEHFSHTSIEDIRSCSLKFFLRKVDRVPQRPGWSLVGGNAVHSVTEAIDRQDFGVPVEPADLDFNAVFDALKAEALERSPEFKTEDFYCAGRKSKENPNKEDEQWWRKHGPLMVQRWVNFKKVSPWDIWLTPQGEPAIELGMLADIDGTPIKMFTDLIMDVPNNGLAVVDKKTGSRVPKYPIQLAIYGEGMAQTFGEECRPQWGAYWMGRTGELTPPVDLNLYYPHLLPQVRSARRIVALDLWLPNPSDLCGSCSVNKSCYAYNPVSILGASSVPTA